jgi:cephalosporin-C deacetylase-like acetyl esterase
MFHTGEQHRLLLTFHGLNSLRYHPKRILHILSRNVLHLLLKSPRLYKAAQTVPRPIRRMAVRLLGHRAEGDLTDLSQHVRNRLLAASRRETDAWRCIQTLADWQEFRDRRVEALRNSLGELPARRETPDALVTRTLHGDDFAIDNLVFESRPGLIVTANLYRPTQPGDAMPGFLICHSHHNSKTHGELQDMGVTWARHDCLVLIIDLLGHGERRQHPFHVQHDYCGAFPVGRQDYYFRYSTGLQLALIGESLMGWMVGDVMRGLDLLLAQPGVEPERIILIGAVAGGGDVAAVTAAVDHRVKAVVPFNFGKGQSVPPSDATELTNYAGSGSWDSTRNLRLSARDGFMPWFVLAALAPRRLLYAHEFAWEPDSDPVWHRLQRIYGLYGKTDHLESLHGSGSVTGNSPHDTHCNNVGPPHRRQIYETLARWFRMPVPTESYYRCPDEEMMCLAPAVVNKVGPKPVYRLAAGMGATRVASARRQLTELGAAARRKRLQCDYGRLLGPIEPRGTPQVVSRTVQRRYTTKVEQLVVEVEEGVTVSLTLLIPAGDPHEARPIVVGFAQEGSQRLRHGRGHLVKRLLRRGIAVCLSDLRGTGDRLPRDEFRGRRSVSTMIASSEMMLGETLLGSRLRDLRSVLRHLRSYPQIDPGRMALWGDSFAPANNPNSNLAVPFDAEPFPGLCEPLAGLLALFGGLFEDVRAIYLRGGLSGYASVLDSPFCYIPYDAIVPGALTAGDLCDVAASLVPRALRMEALVDGLNRKVTADVLAATFRPALAAYENMGVHDRLTINEERKSAEEIADWYASTFRKKPG